MTYEEISEIALKYCADFDTVEEYRDAYIFYDSKEKAYDDEGRYLQALEKVRL